ncbi:MAG TPA: maleylpyruvate isomerase family mycothiol-dependent enzyme [Acidimicrobiales bacterium]|jgi:uncharacterized protein (TIGR03083 family)
MELTPRYDGTPPLRVEVPFDDPSVPLLRQRRRLADTVAGLEDAQWRVPSRCAEWSVQDVIAHLIGVNRFWALSIRSALAGTPTRYLVGFDPVATPRALVEPMRSLTPTAVHLDFVASVDDLADALSGIDGSGWSQPAEAPPGHIALRALALHALWDAWVHERDIVLPLGLDTVQEDDEIEGSLIYAALLGPGVLASGGGGRSGTLLVDARHPTIRFVVEAGETAVARPPTAGDAGASRLEGPAVELIDGISARTQLHHHIGPADRWMVDGLAAVFDPTP